MKLQEKIMQSMSVINESDQNVISKCLLEVFQKYPTYHVSLRPEVWVDSVKVENWSGTYIIKVQERKFESAKSWIESEGFTLRKEYSPKGSFIGYKVFLRKEYQDL